MFRQIVDSESSAHTYLLADPSSGEALLIDPMLEAVPRCLELMDQLDLRLISAVDSADWVTASRRYPACLPYPFPPVQLGTLMPGSLKKEPVDKIHRAEHDGEVVETDI